MRFAFCFLCLLLAGCALPPTDPLPPPPSRHALDAFLLEGRFSLRQDERQHAGRLDWRHTADGDELLLASPFGQGIAEIVTRSGEAVLTLADGQVFTAPDASSLTERAIGCRLPLPRLADWVRGHAAADDDVERDARGRPARLRFEDWSVEYAYGDDDPAALPVSVLAERAGAFELRLRIDAWSAAEK